MAWFTGVLPDAKIERFSITEHDRVRDAWQAVEKPWRRHTRQRGNAPTAQRGQSLTEEDLLTTARWARKLRAAHYENPFPC